jgi:cytoplasmic iron level regulating protein YaaA (DUF328/UPF0246 family)
MKTSQPHHNNITAIFQQSHNLRTSQKLHNSLTTTSQQSHKNLTTSQPSHDNQSIFSLKFPGQTFEAIKLSQFPNVVMALHQYSLTITSALHCIYQTTCFGVCSVVHKCWLINIYPNYIQTLKARWLLFVP